MNVLLLSRDDNSLMGMLIGINYPPCSRVHANIRTDIDWKEINTQRRGVGHNRQRQEQNRR